MLGNPFVKMSTWGITDDTQLTLATIEAIILDKEIKISAEIKFKLIIILLPLDHTYLS